MIQIIELVRMSTMSQLPPAPGACCCCCGKLNHLKGDRVPSEMAHAKPPMAPAECPVNRVRALSKTFLFCKALEGVVTRQ